MKYFEKYRQEMKSKQNISKTILKSKKEHLRKIDRIKKYFKTDINDSYLISKEFDDYFQNDFEDYWLNKNQLQKKLKNHDQINIKKTIEYLQNLKNEYLKNYEDELFKKNDPEMQNFIKLLELEESKYDVILGGEYEKEN
ncbi:hypothetical protein [[Mycoplasma] anseris]|uniref:Uncharacterized protein n=2 Tax=[Mycoplasma] anseris TaxID=92400 RepID=A0A2Z4NCA2_9BACT|nr:hypothetical protein [[Mycoplasma] anseris]AWX69173.1 hypothetical protein DP065_00090 [[Mycoplasma] anseris]